MIRYRVASIAVLALGFVALLVPTVITAAGYCNRQKTRVTHTARGYALDGVLSPGLNPTDYELGNAWKATGVVGVIAIGYAISAIAFYRRFTGPK